MKTLRLASVVFLGMACLVPSDSRSQTTTTPRHKLEPVAETKLIMDGLAKVNLRGLERLLSENP